MTRRVVVAVVLAAWLLLLPGPTRQQATVSLVRLETASAVDLGDGVVWILAVGSDADASQDLMSGNADAIQMVGLDVETGKAVAIGIPRDSWVDVNGSKDRINTGLRTRGGGPELMAELVQDLLGIAPQYVVTSKAAMFADMVDAIGGLTVRSPVAFQDDESGLVVKRGLNRFDGEQAAAFAGSRNLPGYDFSRSANQQRLLRSILAKVRAREDQTGFLETGALAALDGLESDLDPVETYRFANAVAEIDPTRVTTCVIGGTPRTTGGGAAVIIPDSAQARRVARDAEPDAELDRGCR